MVTVRVRIRIITGVRTSTKNFWQFSRFNNVPILFNGVPVPGFNTRLFQKFVNT